MTDVAARRLVPLVALCSLVLVRAWPRATCRHVARAEPPPLPAIGRISYALYLWHLPIFALFRPGTLGLPGLG